MTVFTLMEIHKASCNWHITLRPKWCSKRTINILSIFKYSCSAWKDGTSTIVKNRLNMILNQSQSSLTWGYLYLYLRLSSRWQHSSQDEIRSVCSKFSLCYIIFPCVLKLTVGFINKGHTCSVVTPYITFKMIPD